MVRGKRRKLRRLLAQRRVRAWARARSAQRTQRLVAPALHHLLEGAKRESRREDDAAVPARARTSEVSFAERSRRRTAAKPNTRDRQVWRIRYRAHTRVRGRPSAPTLSVSRARQSPLYSRRHHLLEQHHQRRFRIARRHRPTVRGSSKSTRKFENLLH